MPCCGLSRQLVAATGFAGQRPEGLSHGCGLFRERLYRYFGFPRWRLQLNTNLLTILSCQVRLRLCPHLILPLLLITPTPLLLLSGFPPAPRPAPLSSLVGNPQPPYISAMVSYGYFGSGHSSSPVFSPLGTPSYHDVLTGVFCPFLLAARVCQLLPCPLLP